MMKFCLLFLHVSVIALSIWRVSCATEDEKQAILEAFEPLFKECCEEYSINPDKLKETKGEDMPTGFKKCLLQKFGLLDGNGDFDSASVQSQLDEFVADDDERKKIKNEIETCFKGNEKAKSNEDDEKKRMNDIVECMKKHKK